MLKLTIGGAFVAVSIYIVWLTQAIIVSFAQRAADLSLAVCGGLPVALAAAGVVYAFNRQRHETRRQRDGVWAVEYHYLVSFPKRVWLWMIGRPIPKVRIDPNAYLGHALVIADAVYEVAPSAGWDRQLDYMREVERTNRVRAAVTGDGVTGLPWSNIQRGANGIANAATGRLFAGAYDPRPKPATIDAAPMPQLPAPPVQDLTPAEAVASSQPASLVLGQTDDGELVRWDMAQTPHLRFHGSSRSAGKTNAIQTVATAALRTGAHVIVFDPANLKDWQEFDGRAELVDAAAPATLADGAARLLTIYHNRTRQLARAGARDVSSMARPPRRIVVVICEFGAQCEMARAEGVMDDIETPLLQLARKAAATGIHLVLEDQAVERWPRALSANVAGVAIGRMPLYAAQACGFVPRRNASTETLERGQFWFGGRLLRTPHMEPDLRTLLASVPAPAQFVMLTPPYGGVRSEGVTAEGVGVSAVRPEVANDRTTEQANAEPVGPTDLQAAVWEWRDTHPNAAQADLRRDFEARGIVIARGYAHECWHKWPTQRIEDFTAGRLTEAQTNALFAAGVLGAASGPLPGAERVDWRKDGVK